jgi:hypothetical protein
LAEVVGRLFRDLESAQIVGAEYLRVRPDEADIAKIAGFIFPEGLEDAISSVEAFDVLTRHLADKQRADFEYGRIVNISGWLLAETEARLCALASMTRSDNNGAV